MTLFTKALMSCLQFLIPCPKHRNGYTSDWERPKKNIILEIIIKCGPEYVAVLVGEDSFSSFPF
jgi:hypothetical protein